jgi:hypothetical protein
MEEPLKACRTIIHEGRLCAGEPSRLPQNLIILEFYYIVFSRVDLIKKEFLEFLKCQAAHAQDIY